MSAIWGHFVRLLGLGLIGGVACTSDARASECGGELPCQIEGGEYRIALPEGHDHADPLGRPLGAIMFLHGWRGSAAGEMNNGALRAVAEKYGLAFIAPQGAESTWSYPSSPSQHRDEFAYFSALMDDLKTRFGINSDRVLLSGFSMGGSMVWYLACEMPDRFGGFAPIAGAFWEPQPQSCSGPVDYMLHVHGTSDTVVPINGRPIGDRWQQGDVYRSFSMLETAGACAVNQPVSDPDAVRGLSCTMDWRCNGAGQTSMRLCLHDGGHIVRSEWLDTAWQQLAATKGWDQ
ncbi:MAG: alpha/beta hydrolase-fold protein [Pseudomonadota bacterium]